jgi:hypothetical protein
MNTPHRILPLLVAGNIIPFTLSTFAVPGLDPVTFRDPPPDARPMTWMHMMNNNASKEGLVKDLRALADAGVGGALIFSVKKEVADGRVLFNSPEWREIIVHGAKEAERLGLKIGVHNCDGWSSSGGPWVRIEDSMKQVVCSDAVVSGGRVDVTLAQPPTYGGFYRDIAVLAYPATSEELEAHQNPPTLTGSAKAEELRKLTDGQLDTQAMFAADRSTRAKPWLLFSYAKPFPARSIHVGHGGRNGNATLYASQDGERFEKVVELKPTFRTGKIYWAYEASFPVVTARYFKLEFDTTIALTSVELAPFARLPAWLGQAAFARLSDDDIPAAKSKDFIPLEQVRVLPEAVGTNGHCQTTLPEGIWRIVRFGYTSTGAYNHPATDSGRGNECDKLDPVALDKHFAAYVGKLAEECGPLTGQSFYFSEVDSYEMGGQNWTDGFEKTFRARKGYDLIPLLPLVTGRLIGDPNTADAVLGDFRNLLGQLWTENYFKRFTDLCHEYGIKSYIEPYGNAAFDNLTVGGQADIPMGEFWLDSDRYLTGSAVSAARTYGKPVISAESFTSWAALNWKVHPWLMKRAGDTGWTEGVNEFMFHRFTHQANPHVAPGMTMGSIGSHIDRTQTWWLNAGKAWMKYLQRGQWLLRQGVPVSDLLVYVGEGTPHSQPGRSEVKLPYGYNMDHCDNPVLMQRIRVQDGRLVLPEGTSYAVLLLSNSRQMSLATLARLKELAQAGAVMVGPKPVEPIGYLERTTKQQEFRTRADELWGDASRPKSQGQGWIIPGEQWPAEVGAVRIARDLIIKEEPKAGFIHRRIGPDDVYFIQNRETNSRTLNCSFRVADRIPELWHADTGATERQAQFTQAHGRTEMPITLEGQGSVFVVFRDSAKGFDPIAKVEGQGTPVHVVLDSAGAVQLHAMANGEFAIERSSGKRETISVTDIPAPLPVTGAWQVTFDGLGVTGPSEVTFDALTDWKDHERDDLKHFSGTAAYRKTMDVPAPWLGAGRRVHLNLGRVEICAEVFVNGQLVATLWKPPFSVDVTDYVRAGTSEIEIKVTNLWSNRLIGDEALERTDGYDPRQPMPDWFVNNQPLPPGPRSTFTTFNFYDKDDALLPSGLLGPVSLSSKAQVRVSSP